MPLTDPERIVRLLRSTELLADLPEDDLFELARRARQRQVSAGETVFAKNVGGSNVYLVVEGRLKITTVGPKGNELLLNMIEPGDLCGELGLADGEARSVNAVAEKSSELLVLNRRSLLPVLSRNPKALMKLVLVLCGHIRHSVAILEDLALHTAQTRIWSRLNSLARRYASESAEDGSLRIDHGLSQQSLADSVGLTRVMVNRQLGLWRERGWIDYGRGFIILREQDALEAHVLADR